MTYLVGIAGGSGSGKGTIADLVKKHLDLWDVKTVTFSTDDCYRDFSYLPQDKRDQLCFDPQFNYDHPKSVDFDRLLAYADNFKAGRGFEYARYDFSLHRYGGDKVAVPANLDVVIIEGIYALYSGDKNAKKVVDLYDEKMFVLTTPEIAQLRRIKRDIQQRGREMGHVMKQLERTVIPMYKQFILPSSINAMDVIDWRVDESQSEEAIKQKLVDIARQKALSIYEHVRTRLLPELDLDKVEIGGIG